MNKRKIISKKYIRTLVTAGPTAEPIDPVRVISNRSSGVMGYEIARAAKKRGHRVSLVSGPVFLEAPEGVKLTKIETARELKGKVESGLKKADVLIMASAVSDFRPAFFSKAKIKSAKPRTVKLVKNRDILGSLSKQARKNKVIVGFALETESLLKNASKKLKDKKMDLVVANEAGRGNAPFGEGKKTVYILDKAGTVKKLKNMTKSRIAGAILDRVEELCYTPG